MSDSYVKIKIGKIKINQSCFSFACLEVFPPLSCPGVYVDCRSVSHSETYARVVDQIVTEKQLRNSRMKRRR